MLISFSMQTKLHNAGNGDMTLSFAYQQNLGTFPNITQQRMFARIYYRCHQKHSHVLKSYARVRLLIFSLENHVSFLLALLIVCRELIPLKWLQTISWRILKLAKASCKLVLISIMNKCSVYTGLLKATKMYIIFSKIIMIWKSYRLWKNSSYIQILH